MIFPTPFLGRNDILRRPPRYLIFGFTSGYSSPMLIGTADYKRFYRLPLPSIIAQKLFTPTCELRRGGYLYLGGFYNTNSFYGKRPALLRAPLNDILNFVEIPTGFDVVPGISQIVGLAANANYVVALEEQGSIAVSLDGNSFVRYTNLPAGSNPKGLSIAASATTFVVGMELGGIRSASDPRGTWASRSSGFNNSVPTYNNVLQVMAGAANFVAIARAQLSTAPIASPTTWTRRTTPADSVETFITASLSDGTSTFLVFGGERSGGDGQPLYMRSSNGGLAWASPPVANRPWNGFPINRVGYGSFLDGLFYTYSRGRVAVSPDGLDWDVRETDAERFDLSLAYHLAVQAPYQAPTMDFRKPANSQYLPLI